MTPPAAAAARTAPARRAAPATKPRTLTPRPRRVSGPMRRPGERTPQPGAGAAGAAAERRLRAVPAGLIAAASHLLDRLIAGKAWIVLLAFLLIGVVTLQLGLLELNAGIGRAIVREGQLQRQNAALSIEDAELSSGARVESQATALGMRLVPTGGPRFMSSAPPDAVAKAAQALSTPVQSTGEAAAAQGSEAAAGAGATAQGSEVAATNTQGTETAAGTGAGTTQTGEPAAAATGEASGAGTAASAGQDAAAAQGTSPAAGEPSESAPAGGTQAAPAG